MLLRASLLTTLVWVLPALADQVLLRQWYNYSGLGRTLNATLLDYCSVEAEEYWAGNRTTPRCLKYNGLNCLISPAVDCMIGHMRESDKANMASAAIVLGLLPTILVLAGSTTVETGILSLRRPILATLLAAGSPSFNPLRTLDYRDPIEILKGGTSSIQIDHSDSVWAPYIVILQYIAAGGATTNTFYLSWQLGRRTVCAFAEETSYLMICWSALSVAIHIHGALAVFWRMRYLDTPRLTTWSGWRSLLCDEFRLSAGRSQKKLYLLPETWKFVLISWYTSTGTILHLIFGTMVLSSTLFIGALDAVVIASRFLGSTVICRIVLSYELNGIRDWDQKAPEQRQNEYELLRSRSDLKAMQPELTVIE